MGSQVDPRPGYSHWCLRWADFVGGTKKKVLTVSFHIRFTQKPPPTLLASSPLMPMAAISAGGGVSVPWRFSRNGRCGTEGSGCVGMEGMGCGWTSWSLWLFPTLTILWFYAWAGNKCLATSEDADKPDAVTCCPKKHLPQLSPALLDSSLFSSMDIAEHSCISTATLERWHYL